jgi:ArsR family transcriptional regulator
MSFDAYAAGGIDACQSLPHTDRVSHPAATRSAPPSRPGPRTLARPGNQPGQPVAGLCCAPLLREPITAGQAADLARTLKALADPTRLRLVSMVAAHEGGEACVCDLTEPLGLTQPTVSHHLKVLVEAGIFTRDKRGVWAFYALVPAALGTLATVLTPSAPAPSATPQ